MAKVRKENEKTRKNTNSRVNREENLTNKFLEPRGFVGDKDDFGRIIAISLHQFVICEPFIDAAAVLSTCGYACAAVAVSVEGVRFSTVHDASEISVHKLWFFRRSALCCWCAGSKLQLIPTGSKREIVVISFLM